MKLIESPLLPLVSQSAFHKRLALRVLNEIRLFYRKNVRRKILNILPVYKIKDNTQPPVHILVCKRDFEMALISALMVNHLGKKGHIFIFHDDGSLNDEMARFFMNHFPGCTMIRKAIADRHAEKILRGYPGIRDFRNKQVMALKLIDVSLWSQNKRIGYMDSDVLFFQYPLEYFELLTSSDTNFFNRDLTDAYITNRRALNEAFSLSIPSCINAGLWIMNKETLNFELIESWLRQPLLKNRLHDYRLEQTLTAMLAGISRNKVKHLPSGYDVSFEKNPAASISKHYVGRIRYGYELEGLRYLMDKRMV